MKEIRVNSKGMSFLDILRKKDEKNPPKEYQNFHYILIINKETKNYMAIDKLTGEIYDFINGEIIERGRKENERN